MKILVIEDSERLRRSLQKGLALEGFVVEVAEDGKKGLSYAKNNKYDVVILDLNLPKVDGLTVLRELRKNRVVTQVLILSAKSQVSERVTGLTLGADDYLTKPFAFEELCARIRILARRNYAVDSHTIEIGDLVIDTSKVNVTCQNEDIPLTRSEYQILECLAMRRGRVVSKQELLNDVRMYENQSESNVIEAMMSNLRKKLKSVNEQNKDVIQTKRGFGYIIH